MEKYLDNPKYLDNTGNSELTKYRHLDYAKDLYAKDLIVRIQGSSLENMNITSIKPTATVSYSIQFFLGTLLEIIRSQRKQLDYSGHYIAFLLGQTSEKEFIKISKDYTKEKKECSEDVLREKIWVVQNWVDQEITPIDMAHYFECDELDIIKALKLLNP